MTLQGWVFSFKDGEFFNGEPYIVGIYMGFFILKNPKVEHNSHTMVVHVNTNGGHPIARACAPGDIEIELIFLFNSCSFLRKLNRLCWGRILFN